MAVHSLQAFLENGAAPETSSPVDLIKIARGMVPSQKPLIQRRSGLSPKLSLVVDGECCLDRLYGGYYPDWVCGGQWNRMIAFIGRFINLLRNENIEIIVFFNGCMEKQRMSEWCTQQAEEHKRVSQVFAHIYKKGTPPPKIWWVAPAGIRMTLRAILRHMNVTVASTMEDHRREVISYIRENNLHGLIADDSEYIAFDPPRLFSAKILKLTFKGGLETKEYLLPELRKSLDLSTLNVCVLNALLGNFLLPAKDLTNVYESAEIDNPLTASAEIKVRALAKYIKEKVKSDDIDEIISVILPEDTEQHIREKLKQSIKYYWEGTKEGYVRFKPTNAEKINEKEKVEKSSEVKVDQQEPDLDIDTSKLASEGTDPKADLLNTCKGCLSSEQESPTEDIPLTPSESSEDKETTSSESTNQSTSTNSEKKEKKSKKESKKQITLPTVANEVIRTVLERHSKGLMSPYIYNIVTQGEIKLPVLMENGNEIPNIHSFYKPLRQKVYAIIFNYHHHLFLASKNNTELELDVRIKEWTWNTKSQKAREEYVKVEPVGWRVPTIKRLWFGTLPEDTRRRLRAFLTCMRTGSHLILNQDYVPQHLLLPATVLRYMLSFPDKRVLRKADLDAFLVTALSPELLNPEFTQEIQPPCIISRGVQLAALFMQGLEMAMLANDACGAPVPWLMCSPWSAFDGKLFHCIYYRSTVVKNVQDLCDNQVSLIMKVDRMRQAVLEDLNVHFARPPTYPGQSSPFRPMGGISHSIPTPLALPEPRIPRQGYNRGNVRSARGGQLEVAGVVVGSWGPNYSLSGYHRPPRYLMPQMAPSNRYGNPVDYNSRSGYGMKYRGRGSRLQYDKKKSVKKETKKVTTKGRGVTIAGDGEVNFPSQGSEESGNGSNSPSEQSESRNDTLNGNEGDQKVGELFDDSAIVLNGDVSTTDEKDIAAALKNITQGVGGDTTSLFTQETSQI